ncbi:MAG: hypothetical protein K6T83_08235 [Alicyclobacillus sp.]|nr:hypothetical protein [Alicyclobacillus sp.]
MAEAPEKPMFTGFLACGDREKVANLFRAITNQILRDNETYEVEIIIKRKEASET